MSIAPTLYTAGTAFAAADLTSRVETIETFINGGTSAADFSTSAEWADSRHLVRPEFFGSPDPRVRLTTGPVTYRRRSNDFYQAFMLSDDASIETWTPVHGLCVPIDVQPPPGVVNIDLIARIEFYTYNGDGDAVYGEAARFRMFLDSLTPYESTQRSLAANLDYTPLRVYHSMEKILLNVVRGSHDVGVAVYILSGAGAVSRSWNHIWVKACNVSVREYHR